MAKLQVLATLLIVIGVVLVAVAGIVPQLVPTSYFWTPEQATEQSHAAARLHQATHETAHALESNRTSDAEKIRARQELEAAQARFDQSKAQLAQAQFWREQVPRWCRWSGIGVLAVGLLLMLAGKKTSD